MYLVDQAEVQLRPGANPYRDLINWWSRVKKLQIGRSPDTEAITLASEREDEKMEAWLYSPRSGDFRLGARWTLGTLKHLYTHRHATSGNDAHNWKILVDLVAAGGSSLAEFEEVIGRFVTEQIVDQRNHLAHGEPVPQSVAEALRNSIIGDRGQPGILCWLIENLDTV